MITLQQALQSYQKSHPHHIVLAVLDVGDEWVFSLGDRQTGMELDTVPIAVSKESGSQREFYPSRNMGKLKNASLIPVD